MLKCRSCANRLWTGTGVHLECLYCIQTKQLYVLLNSVFVLVQFMIEKTTLQVSTLTYQLSVLVFLAGGVIRCCLREVTALYLWDMEFFTAGSSSA